MLFKKGDTLKLIDNQYMDAKKGAICMVTEDDTFTGEMIEVKWLDEETSNGQNNGGYFTDRFELV